MCNVFVCLVDSKKESLHLSEWMSLCQHRKSCVSVHSNPHRFRAETAFFIFVLVKLCKSLTQFCSGGPQGAQAPEQGHLSYDMVISQRT